MLQLFTDQQLTRPVTMFTPKQFCVPDEGGMRTSRLYLGDAYTAAVRDPAAAGSATIDLDQVNEFLSSGSAIVAGMTISYTGITGSILTGVTGLTSALQGGESIRPNIAYSFATNVLIAISGADLTQTGISLKRSDQNAFGFLGTAAMFSTQVVYPGSPLAVDVQVSVVAGVDTDFTGLQLLCSGFVVCEANNITPPQSGQQLYAVVAPLWVRRRNQGLSQRERLLPANRQVQPNLPGLIVGSYRWRDQGSENAIPIVPTNWNIDPSSLGPGKFVPGYGSGPDFEPLQVEQEGETNSLFLRINEGFYFTGINRYFLPAGTALEILPANASNLQYTLQNTPRSQASVYVGTYFRNSQGYYEKDTAYRYAGRTFLSDPGPQFTLIRETAQLTLNQALPQRTLFLGTISGEAMDYFTLSLFPVAAVRAIYVDCGLNAPPIYAGAYSFDQNTGLIQVPQIQGTRQGQPVYAVCDPAIAVLYAQDNAWQPGKNFAVDQVLVRNGYIYRCIVPGVSGQQEPQWIQDADAITEEGSGDLAWICDGPAGTLRATADLNPAYAGIAGGYVYLLHSDQTPASVELGVDKPRITIPGTITQIAFGPIYYDGDYALLIATAYDSNNNPLSAVTLNVVPGDDFDGLINYQNPVTTPVSVVTGGDGTANLVYTPRSGFGQYLAPQSVGTTYQANDSLILPAPLEFSQLWNAAEGWLTTLYSVADDNPLYGKLNGDPARGEIPFVTSGTPGTTSFRCNGLRIPWLSGTNPVVPIEAWDTAGNKNGSANFNNQVAKLVFGSALPSAPNIAAYFFSYVERVSLLLSVPESNVQSNSVLLQMAPPPLISNPWLILNDAVNGQLDVFRLGWSVDSFNNLNLPIVGS